MGYPLCLHTAPSLLQEYSTRRAPSAFFVLPYACHELRDNVPARIQNHLCLAFLQGCLTVFWIHFPSCWYGRLCCGRARVIRVFLCIKLIACKKIGCISLNSARIRGRGGRARLLGSPPQLCCTGEVGRGLRVSQADIPAADSHFAIYDHMLLLHFPKTKDRTGSRPQECGETSPAPHRPG